MEETMMKAKEGFKILGIICALAMGCAVGWADISRGSIRGTVTDPQGAVVPAVRIVITNTDAGVQQTARTNSAGFYFVPELVPGPYKVHFEMSGFVPVDIDGVEVKSNEVATVDTESKVGATTQSVTVNASSARVDTTASNFSESIEKTYIDVSSLTVPEVSHWFDQ
jgi:hypothetical protein